MRLKKSIKNKIIGPVHLWLGLASDIIIFIVSITGCIYVFEKEFQNVIYHDYFLKKSDLAKNFKLAGLSKQVSLFS
ncbi:MAG: PepSY-associated TM helix domain-containing protein [Bacteroidota bacterium]